MDHATTFDALVPNQIAAKAEDVGVAKARLDLVSTLLLSILAGAFIALGAIFSTVTIAGTADLMPFGVVRLLAGVTFCLGLILVVVAGAELFTGNNLLVMAFASGKIGMATVLRNWTIVYVGNFIGAALTALGMLVAGLHELGGGAVAVAAVEIAVAKCALSWDQAFVRGAYCNALVCLAIWLCMSCRSTGEKILAILFPITAFVAAGFEHSIANMYFIPFAMLVEASASDLIPHGGDATASASDRLTLAAFLWNNLIPVTLGNIVGGALMVGAVYWTIYCRPRK